MISICVLWVGLLCAARKAKPTRRWGRENCEIVEFPPNLKFFFSGGESAYATSFKAAAQRKKPARNLNSFSICPFVSLLPIIYHNNFTIIGRCLWMLGTTHRRARCLILSTSNIIRRESRRAIKINNKCTAPKCSMLLTCGIGSYFLSCPRVRLLFHTNICP